MRFSEDSHQLRRTRYFTTNSKCIFAALCIRPVLVFGLAMYVLHENINGSGMPVLNFYGDSRKRIGRYFSSVENEVTYYKADKQTGQSRSILFFGRRWGVPLSLESSRLWVSWFLLTPWKEEDRTTESQNDRLADRPTERRCVHVVACPSRPMLLDSSSLLCVTAVWVLFFFVGNS